MKKTQEKLPIKKKLPVNLLMADLYTYNSQRVCVIPRYAGKKYSELVEVQNPDGSIAEKLVERDYPITEDYVKSFEQSSDYRLDPSGAVASAQPRKNLGDISDLQSLYQMDTAAIDDLAKRLTAASAAVKAAQANENKQKERVNNGDESKE